MKNRAVVHFRVKDLSLTAAEKKVVDKLVAAAESIAPIYEQQENPRFEGANLYPHDATKEEILEAAKKDPTILSPYTVVERGKNGEIVATPYHIKYKKQLEKTTKYLKEAAKLTDNRELTHRLYLQADALLDGSYEASDIYWISMKPYKIDISIGPGEKYIDKLFNIKSAYQAWVGIMEPDKTKKAKLIQMTIYDVKRRIFAPSEKADFLDKTQLRVDKTLLFSGLYARTMFTSTSLPIDPNLMERYGIEITFFDTSLDIKFGNQHYPIFQRIFEQEFQKRYTEEILREGSFRNVLLHEIGHSLLRYKDSEARLKELFPVIDELSATIYGIKSCGSLVLKGIISEKELEAIMIMFICRAFTWWIDSKTQPSIEAFAIGHALAVNHFMENGAVQELNGISWPNFSKMFLGIEELSDALERLISIGTYQDAQNFIEKYGSFVIYFKFVNRLKGLM